MLRGKKKEKKEETDSGIAQGHMDPQQYGRNITIAIV